MDCDDVQPHLLDYQRGRLGPELHEEVHAHLEGCATCAHDEAAERALTDLLERRLPQHAASLSLKRRLAEQWAVPAAARPSWWSRWGRSVVPAAAVAAMLLLALPLYYERPAPGGGSADMVREAVNDHLRVLARPRPFDVESGGIHQVKPWFTGRLDFAPVVPFAGDDEFPLRGGALGYFIDRPAAVFVYQRRLHTVSLLVFRAAGLPWPAGDAWPAAGRPRYDTTTSRGFNVILWRAGELGYALVSDVDARDLQELAAKLAPGS